MTALPPVHLAIMQPAGYVHSLGFLDQARFVRFQLRQQGVQVSLAKNRLREDAINIVFGAHLGFPAEWKRRHTCLFFNLEQLGTGGAKVSRDYLDLLGTSAVIDYDPANVAAYCPTPEDVPLVSFGHAPYLHDFTAPALEDRPIDLLFFGSLNERRRAFISKVEACGVDVTLFDHPLYGPERDAYIANAKAVLNCSFYDTSRFEQARASHCLSLGTPVISELRESAPPAGPFADSVTWVRPEGIAEFFGRDFATANFFADARAQLANFRTTDCSEAYAEMLSFAIGVHRGYSLSRSSAPWRPTRLNLGSGKDYKPGWLNLDVLDRAEPDVVLDLGQPCTWPITLPTRFGGVLHLEADSLETVYANNVLEHVPDLPMLMTNVLGLLKEGGDFDIEVPYEKAPTAWQDPTHLRALNEKSWLYYTDWFWYLGWFEHRFQVVQSQWLDIRLQPCGQESAAFMKVRLRKVATTPRERNTARAMQADFGGIPDDHLPLLHPDCAPGVALESPCAVDSAA